jgi:hypothetical protein
MEGCQGGWVISKAIAMFAFLGFSTTSETQVRILKGGMHANNKPRWNGPDKNNYTAAGISLD